MKADEEGGASGRPRRVSRNLPPARVTRDPWRKETSSPQAHGSQGAGGALLTVGPVALDSFYRQAASTMFPPPCSSVFLAMLIRPGQSVTRRHDVCPTSLNNDEGSQGLLDARRDPSLRNAQAGWTHVATPRRGMLRLVGRASRPLVTECSGWLDAYRDVSSRTAQACWKRLVIDVRSLRGAARRTSRFLVTDCSNWLGAHRDALSWTAQACRTRRVIVVPGC